MKSRSKFLYCFIISLFLEGCNDRNILVTDARDAWLNDSDKGLFYCRANVKDNGLADPTCFEAGFQKYENDFLPDAKK
jgi:hypothetical protein